LWELPVPDNTEEHIVVHLTTTLTLTPAQLAAMLLRAEAEAHPEIVAALAETSAPKPPADPVPVPPPAPVEPPAPPPATAAAPEPQPPAARPGRPPRANGKAAPVKAVEPEPDPEPEPEPTPEPDPEPEAPSEPLEEREVRAVLRLFSTIVPGRDAAVVALLQDVGGAPRLIDCDREKWPAIVAAAQRGIAQHAQAAD